VAALVLISSFSFSLVGRREEVAIRP
jgi:hypothetical protein